MTTQTLELILEALEHSEPKMKHYSEPVERHERAINAVRLELELAALQS